MDVAFMPLTSLALRRGVLFVVIASLTGCSAFSSGHERSNTSQATARQKARHWIALHHGETRTFPPRATALPLTIACLKRSGQPAGSGLTQVIRTPLVRNKSTMFGDSTTGPTI